VRSELSRVVARLRDECGTRAAISGMAVGADTIFADTALDAGLELHAYIPFEEQARGWPAASKREWERLRASATRQVVVGALDGTSGSRARLLHARNDAMVRACDLLIAVLDLSATGRKGGSWATVGKEQRWNGRRRPMLLIDASGAEPTRMLKPGYRLVP